MSTVKEPLHPLRTARYLWLGILLCALVGGACFLGGRWSAGRSETAKIDTVVLQNQLSEIRWPRSPTPTPTWPSSRAATTSTG